MIRITKFPNYYRRLRENGVLPIANAYMLRLYNLVKTYLVYIKNHNLPKDVREASYVDMRYCLNGARGNYSVPFLEGMLITPWMPMLRVQLRAFFVNNEYTFELGDSPAIIDAGANIGIASLFFWKTYKPRKLISIEADPDIYENYLTNNLRKYGVGSQPMNKALWYENCTLSFKTTGLDSGNVDPSGDIRVEAIALDDLIDECGTVDLLKMDVEGAETNIIINSKKLNRIKNLYIEIEGNKNSGKNPALIIQKLIDTGFEVYFKCEPAHRSPKEVFAMKNGIQYYMHIYAKLK